MKNPAIVIPAALPASSHGTPPERRAAHVANLAALAAANPAQAEKITQRTLRILSAPPTCVRVRP
jgi:hypothetical protein